MELKSYTSDEIRSFASLVKKAYIDNSKANLNFDAWERKVFPKLYAEKLKKLENQRKKETRDGEEPKPVYPLTINISPSSEELLDVLANNQDELDGIDKLPVEKRESAKFALLKKIIKPAKQITLEGPIKDPRYDVPIWFGDTAKTIDIYLGYQDGDVDLPIGIKFGDPIPGEVTVDAEMSGGTGSGKSVAMHTMLTNAELLYPPWELQLVTGDFKLLELIKHAVPVPSPHVKVVAACENTNFVNSVFSGYADECKRRQILFTKLGIENVEKFREKFGMVLPRMLFMVDEFAQLHTVLKAAVASGSSTAQADLDTVNDSISYIARIGRSQGLHLLLSSQQMGGLIPSSAEGQFSGGLALKVNSAADSKEVIGNPNAAYIKGVGKGYINLNKSAEDSTIFNRMVYIPYINSELKDEELLAGKQTYLTETLTILRKLADDLGFDQVPYTYSDSELPSQKKFETKLETLYDRITKSPYTGDSVQDTAAREAFLKTTAISLLLGDECIYDYNNSYFLDLKYSINENILVSDPENMDYYLRLIAMNIKVLQSKFESIKNYLVGGDILNVVKSGIKEILKDSNLTESREISFPIKTVYNKLAGREMVISLNQQMLIAGENNPKFSKFRHYDGTYSADPDEHPWGFWDTGVALRYLADSLDKGLNRTYSIAGSESGVSKALDKLLRILAEDSMDDPADVSSIGEDKFKEVFSEFGCSFDDYYLALDLLSEIVYYFNTLYSVDAIYEEKSVSDFPKIFVWLVGMDSFEEIANNDKDTIKAASKLIAKGPKYGIFTIATSTIWTLASLVTESFSYLLENEKKEFFSIIGKPVNINTVPDTWTVHNYIEGKQAMLKMYRLGK